MSEHIIETEVFAGFPFVPIGGTDKLREEIVRCEDCKHYVDESGYVDKELRICTYWGDWTTSNGFCHGGEMNGA